MDKLEVLRVGLRPISKGRSEWFSGNVLVERLYEAQDPGRVAVAMVRFEPRARTAWHTHPLGQILIVVDGCGFVQEWEGPRIAIKPGDVIWIPPGVKHWHGASSTTPMAHIAIQEKLGGVTAEWMEHVSDDEYGDPPCPAD
ncbi:MAG: cupin domain-containing protein [Sulfolobales archaeon]